MASCRTRNSIPTVDRLSEDTCRDSNIDVSIPKHSLKISEVNGGGSAGIDSAINAGHPLSTPENHSSQGINVAVVGCGYWGSKHIRVLHSSAGVGRIIAVDRDRELLTQLKNRYPAIDVGTDIDRALQGADAAIIATPPRTHGPMAQVALSAGCHTLVEKPLATTTAQAEALIRLADERQLILMSGHTFQYNPAVWKLRELVADGELGRVHHITTSRLNLGLCQGDVNVLWDLAPHDISILNYVLASQPTTVAAWAAAHAHHPVEDVAYLRLHYAHPSLSAQVQVSWLDPCKTRKVTVVGSRKMAVYDDVVADERVKVFDKGLAIGSAQSHEQSTTVSGPPAAEYRTGGVESPYIDQREPLLLEVEAFVASIQTGSPPSADGRSGLAVVQVLEAADRSIQIGQPVEVDYSPLLTDHQTRPVAATAAAGTAGWSL